MLIDLVWAGLMLINHPGLSTELELTSLDALLASSLLLLPPLAWIGRRGHPRHHRTPGGLAAASG